MYYTGTAKYQKEDEHGRLKLVTEQYLVDAVSFTEAEAKLYQFLGDSIRGEFKVKSISESGITDVFDYEDGGIYYQSTVAYFVAEESGKEKMVKNKMLIEARNIIEAIERFFEPQSIATTWVIWLSLLAILVNGFSVLLIKKDAHVNMNMKSAYLHLLTDMMASVAVLVGGLVMKYFAIFWIDPLLTLLIAFYLIYMGYDLLKESTRVLMLFTPKSILVQEIVASISEIEGIKNVHHVHIWQLNEEEIHLEAHIDFMEDIKLSTFDTILEKIEELVYHKHGINHVNIQPEFGKCDSKKVIVQD